MAETLAEALVLKRGRTLLRSFYRVKQKTEWVVTWGIPTLFLGETGITKIVCPCRSVSESNFTNPLEDTTDGFLFL